jgi:hypothetical protein
MQSLHHARWQTKNPKSLAKNLMNTMLIQILDMMEAVGSEIYACRNAMFLLISKMYSLQLDDNRCCNSSCIDPATFA